MPKKPRIRIYPVGDTSGRYVAAFTSEVLGATFSVVFNETVTGAVALHLFTEMLRSRYGSGIELAIVDTFSPPKDSPVHDVLATLKKQFLPKPASS